MARVDTPSYIKIPGGRMGDAVLYSVGSRTYMRSYVIPRNPKTPLQQKNRSLFAEAMASWKSLPDEEKYIYKKRTMTLNMLPHNLYIREYIKAGKQENFESVNIRPEKINNKAASAGVTVRGISITDPLFFRCPSEASPSDSLYGSYTVPGMAHNTLLRQLIT